MSNWREQPKANETSDERDDRWEREHIAYLENARRHDPREYQLWEEGSFTNGDGQIPARYLGTYIADSLEDAVRKHCAAKPDFEKYYKVDWVRFSSWALRFFDNEADARHSFG